MGSGRFDASVYASARAFRSSAGVDDFHYSKTTLAADPDKWKVHAELDPALIKVARESRDSAEHPETVAVAVLFDVTGSMHLVPRVFQEKLPKLMTLLVTKGGLEHPHLLFGAIGDATCDRIPFQVGQFESDNRCDEQLRSIVLEAGGGGQDTESYELAYYFAGWKTALDCVEKRGKKGYLFTLGDERFYPAVLPQHVHRVFGDVGLQGPIPTERALAKAQERFEVFHVHVQEGSYRDHPAILGAWRGLLGERVIVLEDATLVCETIASAVAMLEGVEFRDVAEGLGLGTEALERVQSALAGVTPGVTRPATVEGPLPPGSDSGAAERL